MATLCDVCSIDVCRDFEDLDGSCHLNVFLNASTYEIPTRLYGSCDGFNDASLGFNTHRQQFTYVVMPKGKGTGCM
jgi:hypothetical protein